MSRAQGTRRALRRCFDESIVTPCLFYSESNLKLSTCVGTLKFSLGLRCCATGAGNVCVEAAPLIARAPTWLNPLHCLCRWARNGRDVVKVCVVVSVVVVVAGVAIVVPFGAVFLVVACGIALIGGEFIGGVVSRFIKN